MTRITNSMLARNVLRDIDANSARLTKIQNSLSSGKVLNKPSDDPAAIGRALQYRKDIEATQQHQRNASEALGWAEVTDSALRNVSDAVLRMRDLVVQGASVTAGPDSRTAIGKELTALIDTVKTAGNASYGGRYVFSGSKTDVAPYVLGGPDTYQGDQVGVLREIGPGVSVQVNVDGQAVIGTDGDGLLGTMRTVLGHMGTGNIAALSASLSDIDKRLEELNASRATVGATTNRIEFSLSRLTEYEGTALELLNEVESVDIGKAMIEFSTQKAAMEAGLKAGASIVQNSLLDFLR